METSFILKLPQLYQLFVVKETHELSTPKMSVQMKSAPLIVEALQFLEKNQSALLPVPDHACMLNRSADSEPDY